MSSVFAWWLLIEALGIIGAPLTATILRNLPDRGWALTKPLSLLVFGWLVWLPLSLANGLPFSRGWIIGTLVVYALGNAALLVWAPATRAALLRLLRESWDYLALTEVVFSAAFALMIWERSFTPAVVDTEKFMDEAFLSAIWRAPHLPPPDPWLSGYSINYYYFGHYLMALIAKLLGTVPAVAFNLAVGLIFALAAVAIFGVASNLIAASRGPSRSLASAGIAGVIAAILTLVAGNFNGAQVWLAGAQTAVKNTPALGGNVWAWWTHHNLWPTYDWWSPSRVVPNTINEFPAFSFVLADLHAHVLALPFAALAVGVAFNLLLGRERGLAAFGGRLWTLGLLGCAVTLGGLYVINGWDLPTYVGLALLALAIQQWLAHERMLTRALLLDIGRVAVALVLLLVLLYLPFYLTFSSPSQGVGFVPPDQRSPIGYVWDMFALPAFIALSLLALRLGPWIKRAALPSLAIALSAGEDSWLARLATAPGAALAAAGLLLLGLLSWWARFSGGWTLLWALLVIALCATVMIWSLDLHTLVTGGEVAVVEDARASRADLMTLLMIGTAAALIGACEVVFLRDIFSGGPYGALGPDFRMNTVFKFYYQVWLLLGIVSGPALVWIAGRLRGVARLGWRTPLPVTAPSPAVTDGAETAAPALALAGAGGVPSAPRAVDGGARDEEPDSADDDAEGWVWDGAAASDWRDRAGWRGAALAGVALWTLALVALLLAATVYPIQAVAARTQNLSLSRSLDGAAYMSQDAQNVGDEQAIAWLNTHVSGDPVIVEAAQYNEYTHLGRISAFTGLPTIIGWGGHEEQWRYNWLAQPGRANVLGERLNAVKLIYTNPNSGFVLSLLRSYDVRYVYVGAAERELYGPQLNQFATYLTVVYQQANVTIYEVPDAQAG